MKLYHYVTKGNNVMDVGLLSISANPHADISYYFKRSGTKTHKGVCSWMERCFKERSRAIRFFTTPLQWTEKSLLIKELVDNCDLFEINVSALAKDGLVEAVYVKPSLFDGHYFSVEEREHVFNEQLRKTGAGYFDYYLIHGIEQYVVFCDLLLSFSMLSRFISVVSHVSVLPPFFITE